MFISFALANTIFREAIGCNIDGEGTIYTCHLDLSKAFERVDHQTLIKKLKEKRMPQFITSVFEFILSRSRISVNFNGSFSQQWKIVRGLRQGGVTSAFLFNIYINDILDEISNLKVGCKIGINKINIFAYADDMILMAPSDLFNY